MHTVNVWPSRYVVGWDGDRTRPLPSVHPIVDFREAVFSVYDTDAHFCPAVLPTLEQQPRLKMSGATPALLDSVRFTVLALDIDAPGHLATEEWWESTVQTIQQQPVGNGLIYCTKGGIRVLYELPTPCTIKEYNDLHAQVRKAYEMFGVHVDPLTDWTRCYRLPFVVRDGVRQSHPVYDSKNPLLLVDLLPECLETKGIFERAAVGAREQSFALDGIGAVKTIGRNQTLFRIAASFRDFRWMDRDTLDVAVRAINDNLPDPLPDSEVSVLLDSAWKRYEPTRGEETIEQEVAREEIIVGGGKIHHLQKQAIEALKNAEGLYTREGRLVRVQRGELVELPKEALPGLLCEVAEWRRPAKEDGTVPCDPPPLVVAGVFSAGEYPLPEVKAVQRTPSLRPDGSLITETGYDPSTRLYNALEVAVVPALVRSPPEAALGRLKALFEEFPFEAPEHLSVTLAALMTPILRPAITGPTPLFLFDSNTPGSGKTIQADIVAIVSTGQEAPRMSMTGEEETEKRVTAILSTSVGVVLIDNIEPGRPLGGAALDALLTSDRWVGRQLGRSQMVTYPNRAVWLATGNNVSVKGDLVRRTMRSYLDPGVERPEERTFRIKDLRAHVAQNRSQIITDILCIASARHKSGYQGPSYGSFESWSYWVRDTLMWLGLEDPVKSQNALRDTDTTSAWRRFLQCATLVWGDKSFTAKDVQEVAMGLKRVGQAPGDAYAGITATLSELVKDINDLARISKCLKTWTSRVLGGYRLKSLPRATLKGPSFSVERTDDTLSLVHPSSGENVIDLPRRANQE
jgi:putative DNA primase/helicase